MYFELNEINGIKDYFIAEIYKRETVSKTLSKYIATFRYIDKTLLILYAVSGGVSISLFATVLGVPVGITSINFSLVKELS